VVRNRLVDGGSTALWRVCGQSNGRVVDEHLSYDVFGQASAPAWHRLVAGAGSRPWAIAYARMRSTWCLGRKNAALRQHFASATTGFDS